MKYSPQVIYNYIALKYEKFEAITPDTRFEKILRLLNALPYHIYISTVGRYLQPNEYNTYNTVLKIINQQQI